MTKQFTITELKHLKYKLMNVERLSEKQAHQRIKELIEYTNQQVKTKKSKEKVYSFDNRDYLVEKRQ